VKGEIEDARRAIIADCPGAVRLPDLRGQPAERGGKSGLAIGLQQWDRAGSFPWRFLNAAGGGEWNNDTHAKTLARAKGAAVATILARGRRSRLCEIIW